MKKEESKLQIGHPGYWNGEPARFEVVEITVGDEPEEMKQHFTKQPAFTGKRYLWFVPFIGQKRQAVRVIYKREVFYLDNSDGMGLNKVLNGGSPRHGHKSIYPGPQSVIRPLPSNEWIHYSYEKYQHVEEEVKAAWIARDPTYIDHLQQMEILRKSFTRSTTKH
ncbi:hypothetical protein [Chitinophaga varians]|uniref:hypothetical protein n=1 Tax=Chitinophaga varians TaxID=2202339 RepID=UPI00165FFFBA|nr:hypothetical protein [Chitinophaga varians]MBC9913141.1 hypothetical protein [Chitinophaga varians]